MHNRANGPWVLGLASTAHNGAACLLKGETIVVAIQEERLTRRKRARLSAGTPSLAISYCLDFAGIGPRDLDAIVTCVLQGIDQPRHQVESNPQLHEARCPTFVVTHHLGHAISAFATSGFEQATILIVDGAGSLLQDLPASERRVAKFPPGLRLDVPEICEAHSIYEVRNGTVTPIDKQMGWWLDEDTQPGMKAFGSLGGMYSAVGQQIFGDSLNGPGKVMGLSSFGTPEIPAHEFVETTSDGLTFKTDVLRRFDFDDPWPSHRTAYENLAASVQAALEEALLELVRRARIAVPSERLCYAGGVALNSIANERIFREAGFQDLFILPAAEDSGTALGAAFHGLWQIEPPRSHRLRSDALGRPYERRDILESIGQVPAIEWVEPTDLAAATVDLLTAQKFVGWFQGRAELGPRALGQRSILCDPRGAHTKEHLNNRIKHREGFRPFAPVVLAEEAERWFEVERADSPFMLRVWRFRPNRAAEVPAVAHCDGTGRVQTVNAIDNPELHALLSEFFRRTGIPVLLNTSLNVAGDPIAETPEDAAWYLLETDLDHCVLGGFVARRQSGYRSLLDLEVCRTGSWVDGESDVEVRTRWGVTRGTLPPAGPVVLRELTASLKGRELLARPAIAAEFNEQTLLRTLAALRRIALIALRIPRDAHQPSLNEGWQVSG